jgi:hypothetical protein
MLAGTLKEYGATQILRAHFKTSYAVVRHRLRKAHADTGSHRGRYANEEGILSRVRGKGGREDGRKCETEPSTSSEAQLNNLEHEAATLGLVFLVAYAGGLLLLIHFLGEIVVLAFLRAGIPEQLTHRGVARLCDDGLIKIARLVLHHFHLATDQVCFVQNPALQSRKIFFAECR